MPQVRKLAPEEVKTLEDKGKGQRKLTQELYDRILSEYEIGDYGEATLDEGEKRLTVRNRLKAAAGRRSIGLEFKRTPGNLIRFSVIEPSRANGNGMPAVIAEVVSSEVPAPVKRRGGKPKKAEQPSAPAKRRGGRPKKTAEAQRKARMYAFAALMGGSLVCRLRVGGVGEEDRDTTKPTRLVAREGDGLKMGLSTVPLPRVPSPWAYFVAYAVCSSLERQIVPPRQGTLRAVRLLFDLEKRW